MNPIQTHEIAYGGINWTGGQNQIVCTYLKEPKYQVRAHFEWDMAREDLKQDRLSGKHYAMAKKYLNKGGGCLFT